MFRCLFVTVLLTNHEVDGAVLGTVGNLSTLVVSQDLGNYKILSFFHRFGPTAQRHTSNIISRNEEVIVT